MKATEIREALESNIDKNFTIITSIQQCSTSGTKYLSFSKDKRWRETSNGKNSSELTQVVKINRDSIELRVHRDHLPHDTGDFTYYVSLDAITAISFR